MDPFLLSVLRTDSEGSCLIPCGLAAIDWNSNLLTTRSTANSKQENPWAIFHHQPKRFHWQVQSQLYPRPSGKHHWMNLHHATGVPMATVLPPHLPHPLLPCAGCAGCAASPRARWRELPLLAPEKRRWCRAGGVARKAVLLGHVGRQACVGALATWTRFCLSHVFLLLFYFFERNIGKLIMAIRESGHRRTCGWLPSYLFGPSRMAMLGWTKTAKLDFSTFHTDMLSFSVAHLPPLL